MRCCRRVRSPRRRVSIGPAGRCILLGQPCRGLRACRTGRQFAPACGTSLQWWGRTSQRSGSSTTSRGQPMSREWGKQEGRATCMVRAVFPTPPSPSTTSLYSVIFPAMVSVGEQSRPRQFNAGSESRADGAQIKDGAWCKQLATSSQCRLVYSSGIAADQRAQRVQPRLGAARDPEGRDEGGGAARMSVSMSWSQTAVHTRTAAQGRVSTGSCRRFRMDRLG